MFRSAIAILGGGLFLVGCTSGLEAPSGDLGGRADLASNLDAGADLSPDDGPGTACGATICAPGLVCRFGSCIDPPPACTDDTQCGDDSYCEGGECIAYGVGPRGNHDPSCQRLEALGLFAPQAQCQWLAPQVGEPRQTHVNVLSTPLVVDFDFDDDPATLHPSIVFVTYNGTDGAAGAETYPYVPGPPASGCTDATTVADGCFGVIRIIDGQTCALQHTFGLGQTSGAAMVGSVTPALGDLDGDGRPEIVTERIGGGIIGYRYNSMTGVFEEMFHSTGTTNWVGSPVRHWGSLAIHDLDDDGVPEIVQLATYPAVYDNQGNLLDAPTAISASYGTNIHPVLADLDGDGKIEMFDGREAFRFDGSTKKWVVASGITGSALGQVAYADFGTYGAISANDDRSMLDGIPEVVVITSGKIRVQTLDGRVVFPQSGTPMSLPVDIKPLPQGGPPTVADFDGDGRVEVGVAGAEFYSVFDPDCVTGAIAAACPSGSISEILWSKRAQDWSSNRTGSSVFDFEGDGKAEVVYADECFSRVYDGRSGDVLFSEHHTSCTWYENPIVADVDGDLKSEVVIPSNANCSVSCPALDPIDDGRRCDTAADCPNALACERENVGDAYGRCRCSTTPDCGSSSLSCTDPIAGPSPKGKVCRASHPGGSPLTGVKVLRDALDRWVGSRPIWNQHAYAVTNVNDDGTIPKTSLWKQNWKTAGLNNFRMNVQGLLDPTAVPDLTSSGNGPPGQHIAMVCTLGGVGHLEARLCNRGTGPVGQYLPLTFYVGPKSAGMPICTTLTSKALQPGQCDVVGCDWPNAPSTPTDVTIIADDDGAGTGETSECNEANNVGLLKGVFCEVIQ